MLKELINRVRGQVWLRVTCPYPERVLNLCSARKLAFWDLEWEGAETFTCRMSRGDHRVLSRAAEKLDCTIEIVRREGAPYTLAKLRHRQALAVGIAACGTAVLIGSFFVWDIQIAGNETVPREVILRSLEKNGVHRGCFGFALNGEDIRNHVLLEIPELSWVAVNVSGCRANVEVRERRTAPKPLDRKTPCNLVARRDGLVLRVQALGGVPQVMKGMSVTEGQLLISGVEDTGTFGTRFTAGLGSVEGRTWYTLTANVPLTGAEKRYTGREKRLRSVIFGSRRIKFFANSSIDSGQCDNRENAGSGVRSPAADHMGDGDSPVLRNGAGDGHAGPAAEGDGGGAGSVSPQPCGSLRRGNGQSGGLPAPGGCPDGDADGGVPGGTRDAGPYLYSK